MTGTGTLRPRPCHAYALTRQVVQGDTTGAVGICRGSLSSSAVSARRVPSGELEPVVLRRLGHPHAPCSVELAVLHGLLRSWRTRAGSRQTPGSMHVARAPCSSSEGDQAHEVLAPEHLVHHAAHEVHVLVADLHEDAAALGEELARDRQAVAQVGEVRVDAELPGVAERLDLLGLAGRVLGLAVLHVALARAHLPVAAELDAVGRVHVDHLDLALEALLLGQRGHHQQRVAEDHAVGPVLLVAVELDELLELDAVVVVEQRHLGLGLALARRVAQVLDDHLRQDLLLDVDGDDRHLEVAGVLLVLALPHELRVERRVAGVEHGAGRGFVTLHEAAQLVGGDVGALLVVAVGLDGLGAGGLLRSGHQYTSISGAPYGATQALSNQLLASHCACRRSVRNEG